MALIVRAFQARQGRGAAVFDCLRTAAAAIVRDFQAGTVVICTQTNDSEQFVWVGDRGSESDFRRMPLTRQLSQSFDQNIARSSAPLAFGFLDEFYHFPASPHQVWSVEVCASDREEIGALGALFELAQVARRDRRVVGMSLYRAVEAPGAFVSFVALEQGFTPSRLLRSGSGSLEMIERIERGVTWRPLSVAYEVKRLPAGRQGPTRKETGSVVPFWARSGEASMTPGAAPEGAVVAPPMSSMCGQPWQLDVSTSPRSARP